MAIFLPAAAEIQKGRIAEAQGKFAKKVGIANEQAALANQQALERQAKAEKEASRIEEGRISRKGRIVKGRQRTTIGKGGIGLVGATLAALTDTAFQFSFERNLALRRGLLRARQLQFAGRIEAFRGGVAAAKGRFARGVGRAEKRASFIRAGGSVVSTFGQFGGAR